MANVVRETIVNTRENEVTVQVDQPLGTPLAWTGVTRIVAGFSDSAVLADTAADATLIDFSVDGFLTFKLGDLGVAFGERTVTVTTFDGSGNDIDVINPRFPDTLIFDFVATTTIP